jgi:hypothetical protein
MMMDLWNVARTRERMHGHVEGRMDTWKDAWICGMLHGHVKGCMNIWNDDGFVKFCTYT